MHGHNNPTCPVYIAYHLSPLPLPPSPSPLPLLSLSHPLSLSQITQLIDSVSGEGSFSLGRENIRVVKGDRFILLSIDAAGIYRDNLTCQSDQVSETATVRIIPGMKCQ